MVLSKLPQASGFQTMASRPNAASHSVIIGLRKSENVVVYHICLCVYIYIYIYIYIYLSVCVCIVKKCLIMIIPKHSITATIENNVIDITYST